MEINRFNLAWLSITYNCNNQCKWCYARSNEEKHHKKIMNLSLGYDSINLISSLGAKNIIFIGGEPTMHEDLPEFIKKVKQTNSKASIVTNGRKLSDKNYAKNLKDSGVDYVTISVESENEKEHDTITQIPGSFKQTMNGLENCLDEEINISTETTISTLNKNNLENLIVLLKNKGIKKITFNLCSSSIGAENSSPYTIGPKEGAKIIQDLYLFGKSVGTEIKSVTPLPLCNFNQDVAKEMINKKLLNTSCHLFFGTSFVVDYNGDILPCVHFAGYPFFNLISDGKIKTKEEFLQEYNLGIGKEFRDKLWKYPSLACEKDKDRFGKCVGGCPILWLKYNPEKEIYGMK